MGITRDTLLTLEAYAGERQRFRAHVLEHKKHRRIALGAHVTLMFEDELTIRYQIQEMLRAERIFEEDGINTELEAYLPLLPDGSNWKATMLIEYTDPEERAVMLGKLIGAEDTVWIQVAGCARIYAIADEDLPRENEVKTSAVHFLRFELDSTMIAELRRGALVAAGVEHRHYTACVDPVARATITSLAADLMR